MATATAPPDPDDGFEAPDTLYALTWADDPSMAGLKVTVKEPSIDALMSMSGMAADPKAMAAEQIGAIFKVFAGLLDSWNVRRKGVPVPATYEGVISCGPAFITKIITAMNKEFTKADPTSPAGSSTGETSGLETSIPMTPLPPSPPGS